MNKYFLNKQQNINEYLISTLSIVDTYINSVYWWQHYNFALMSTFFLSSEPFVGWKISFLQFATYLSMAKNPVVTPEYAIYALQMTSALFSALFYDIYHKEDILFIFAIAHSFLHYDAAAA